MNYVGNKWLNLPWKGRLATEHYRQLNTEIYGIYTGLSETIYYTQRLFS